jgi:hypothetical protein
VRSGDTERFAKRRAASRCIAGVVQATLSDAVDPPSALADIALRGD